MSPKPLVSTLVLALSLLGCGGGGEAGGDRRAPAATPPAAGSAGGPSTMLPGTSPAPTAEAPPVGGAMPPPAEVWVDPEADHATAMALWRNGDLSRHPKGSCAGCHGADFFDLARIGSTDEDIVRRAAADGATPGQAQALRRAVLAMRIDMDIPPTDARRFRPFQPGGAMLLPDLEAGEGSERERIIERDIAFARSLEARLPTLFGARIESLDTAHRAADEFLDIAEGTDRAGANPDLVQLRDLPNGVPYPPWSADRHHGAHEGTLNDWIADVAHEAPSAERDEWFAVQDTWLGSPTRANFWRMYLAAEELVQTTQFEHCAFTGEYTFAESACGAARGFSKMKFLSALIGQHQLRVPFDPTAEDLMDGALAFAGIDDDPALDFMKDRKEARYLPANPWDIGDNARVMVHRERSPGSLREQLGNRGFPAFVVDSADPARSTLAEEEDLRIAWFWQGFTMDPSFQRIGKGTSRSAEYMVESFDKSDRYLHLSFSAHMRLVTKGFLQSANVTSLHRRRDLVLETPRYAMDYSYFNGYGRTVLPWGKDRKQDRDVPAALKTTQEALFHRMTANGYRMSLHLYLEAIEDGAEPRRENLDAIKAHFDAYQPEHGRRDIELLNRVKIATGDAALYAIPD